MREAEKPGKQWAFSPSWWGPKQLRARKIAAGSENRGISPQSSDLKIKIPSGCSTTFSHRTSPAVHVSISRKALSYCKAVLRSQTEDVAQSSKGTYQGHCWQQQRWEQAFCCLHSAEGWLCSSAAAPQEGRCSCSVEVRASVEQGKCSFL